MIRISFTPPDALAVSGTAQDLRAVGEKLDALAAGAETEILVAADADSSPAPYAEALHAFVARATTGPTRVSVVAGRMEVAGSPESFGGFASFFCFDDAAAADAHHHHEYYEGNCYVHPQSVPLVVSVRPR